MNVALLPGLFGTEMYFGQGFPWPWRKVWVDPAAILQGDLAYLQLSPGGASPGPMAGGYSVLVGSPIEAIYRPLWLWLTLQGHRVAYVGYDWRRSVMDSGAQVWASLAPGLGGQPVALVGHSLGGLVARAAYGAMQAAGAGGQLARLVTIGTPHYGSWATVYAWWRLHQLYRGLRVLAGWARAPRQGPEYLDAVMASWPSLFELQPWAAFGPLSIFHPDQAAAIYQPGWYRGANHYLLPSRWTQAQAVQARLNAMMPADTIAIVGVGHPTIAAMAAPPGAQGPPGGAVYEDGDGNVTLAEASPAAAQTITVSSPHDLMPLDPAVQVLVASILA